MAEVWAESEQSGSALLLLLALADNADTETREAWPSVPYLAKKTRLHRATVMRLVARLEADGEIEVIREDGKVNRYRICTYPSQVATGQPEPVASEHSEPVAPVASDDGTSRIAMRPEPSVEPSSASSLAIARSEAAAPNTQTLVKDWVDASREIGRDPPRRLIGQISAQVKKLLDDGCAGTDVAAGLRLLAERGVNPTALPSLVYEAQAPRAPPRRYGRGVTSRELFDAARRDREREQREGNSGDADIGLSGYDAGTGVERYLSRLSRGDGPEPGRTGDPDLGEE